jgi:hypothetical protein
MSGLTLAQMRASAAAAGLEVTSSRKLANNTLAGITADGANFVLLHKTVVFHEDKRGRVTLNSGGWKTVTTKDRISSALKSYNRKRGCNWSLVQNRGAWYLSPDGYWDGKDNWVPFEDGIQLHYKRGIPKTWQTSGARKAAADKRVLAMIDRYITKCGKVLDKDGHFPEPSGGDCWYCYMCEVGSGKPLGDAIKDREHILSHLREGYIMGSLIANALKSAGAGVLWYEWAFKGDSFLGAKSFKTQILRMIKRYLKRQMGIAC